MALLRSHLNPSELRIATSLSVRQTLEVASTYPMPSSRQPLHIRVLVHLLQRHLAM